MQHYVNCFSFCTQQMSLETDEGRKLNTKYFGDKIFLSTQQYLSLKDNNNPSLLLCICFKRQLQATNVEVIFMFVRGTKNCNMLVCMMFLNKERDICYPINFA